MYCIYTDTIISPTDSSEEHIIPLSLGGKNGFTIKVSKSINSNLGAKIDGSIEKDFFINATKRKNGYKGHSKKLAKYRVYATIAETGEKVEIRYVGTENYLYNPRTKKKYTEEEKRQTVLDVNPPFDYTIRIRFVAKVLLGTGYFIYGNTFKENVDHENLRKIMNWEVLDENNNDIEFPLGFMDEFSNVPENSVPIHSVFKTVCAALACSCVIFVIGPNQIIGAVGIGGRYIGAVNFKANGEKFDFKEGPYDGIILAIQNNKIKRGSFHNFLKKIQSFKKKKGGSKND